VSWPAAGIDEATPQTQNRQAQLQAQSDVRSCCGWRWAPVLGAE